MFSRVWCYLSTDPIFCQWCWVQREDGTRPCASGPSNALRNCLSAHSLHGMHGCPSLWAVAGVLKQPPLEFGLRDYLLLTPKGKRKKEWQKQHWKGLAVLLTDHCDYEVWLGKKRGEASLPINWGLGLLPSFQHSHWPVTLSLTSIYHLALLESQIAHISGLFKGFLLEAFSTSVQYKPSSTLESVHSIGHPYQEFPLNFYCKVQGLQINTFY